MGRLLGFLVVLVIIGLGEPLTRKRIAAMFRTLMATPSFDPVKVLGKPWVITYSWNQRYGNVCIEFLFKNITKKMVERVRGNVGRYLSSQPNWNRAVLKMVMPNTNLGMILITSPGPPGTMTGIEMKISAKFRDNIHFYRYAFKLFEDKYLVRLNLDSGIAVLMQRKGVIDRENMEQLVKTLDFGYGSATCL